MKPFLFFSLGLAISISALVFTGCSSVPADQSDLPWNTPESWEGSPFIPGLSDR